MAANTVPVFPDSLKVTPVTIVNATGTTAVTCFTPGADGSRLDSIRITSTDSADKIVMFYLAISGTDYLIGDVSVPAGSGSGTGPEYVEALDSLNAEASMFLATGAVLKAKVSVAMTADKTMTITSFGGDY